MAKQMTKAQIDHLQNSVNREINAAVERFKEKLPKLKNLTEEEKVKLLRSGKGFKFRFDANGGLPYYTSGLFEFDHDEKVKVQHSKNNEAAAKFAAPLRAEAIKIMDAAVLGGADEALAALRTFAERCSKA